MSSEQEGNVQIQISAEDEFSETFNDLIDQSSQASENLGGLADSEEEVASSSQTAGESMQNVSQSVQQTNEQTSTGAFSMRDYAQNAAGSAAALGSVATSAYALNDSYLQLQDSNLRLTDAENNVQKSENTLASAHVTLQQAQEKLNLLVAEGINAGPQYMAAQNAVTKAQNSLDSANMQLTNSQNNLVAAQNRVQMANEQISQQWLMVATSSIPMVLSNLDNLQSTYEIVKQSIIAHQLATEADTAATEDASAETGIFDGVLDANPIGAVVLAITALVAIIGIATDGFKNWTPIINVLNGAFEDLKKAGQDVFGFFEMIFGTEIKIWETALNDFYDLIKPIVQGLQEIAAGASKIGGGLGSIGSDISNAIPHFASGGIVSSPTLAMVGEAGPEMITPLGTSPGVSGQAVQITVNQTNYVSSNVDMQNANQNLLSQLANNLRTGS